MIFKRDISQSDAVAPKIIKRAKLSETEATNLCQNSVTANPLLIEVRAIVAADSNLEAYVSELEALVSAAVVGCASDTQEFGPGSTVEIALQINAGVSDLLEGIRRLIGSTIVSKPNTQQTVTRRGLALGTANAKKSILIDAADVLLSLKVKATRQST
jgi:hypothetical protein